MRKAWSAMSHLERAAFNDGVEQCRIQYKAIEQNSRRYKWIRSPDSPVAEVCNSAEKGMLIFKSGDELDEVIDNELAKQDAQNNLISMLSIKNKA